MNIKKSMKVKSYILDVAEVEKAEIIETKYSSVKIADGNYKELHITKHVNGEKMMTIIPVNDEMTVNEFIKTIESRLS